jgi:hypothetical protein
LEKLLKRLQCVQTLKTIAVFEYHLETLMANQPHHLERLMLSGGIIDVTQLEALQGLKALNLIKQYQSNRD